MDGFWVTVFCDGYLSLVSWFLGFEMSVYRALGNGLSFLAPLMMLKFCDIAFQKHYLPNARRFDRVGVESRITRKY